MIVAMADHCRLIGGPENRVIRLSPYDADWPARFEQERTRIIRAWDPIPAGWITSGPPAATNRPGLAETQPRDRVRRWAIDRYQFTRSRLPSRLDGAREGLVAAGSRAGVTVGVVL